MSKDRPYRFALMSHASFDDFLRSNFAGDKTFTLDSFKIPYNQPLFSIPDLVERGGYEAILCHSSLGLSLLHDVGQVMIVIGKTDLDIIKALLRAREVSREVVLPVHDNENIDVSFLEKLLDMEIHVVSYQNMETLQAKLKELCEQGQKVFLGGGACEAVVSYYDTHFFRIMPNVYSIKQAIDQAKGVAKARREEGNSKDQLVAMLRISKEGVICVDEEGSLVFFNDNALELLKINKTKGKEALLKNYYQKLMIFDVLSDAMPREDVVMSIKGEQFIVTTLPIPLHAGMQGAVTFIRDVNTIQTLSGRLRESRNLTGFIAHHEIEDFKGETPPILRLKKMLCKYAQHSAAVFIHGETGTGKEVLAQALHNASPRRNEPFVALNCAALPDSLLESELFGYEEGAFTGAKKGGKPGVFELAHKGTLFLDEIGDMGGSAQLRLLRVLEARELVRIGGERVIPVDIQVVSASNSPLAELTAQGGFRRDLFYRLATLRLHIPPLRNRLQDIPLLLEKLFARYNKKFEDMRPAMLKAVKEYSWPGNVRELLAFMESYLIMLSGKQHDEVLFMDMMQDWIYEGPRNDTLDCEQGDVSPETTLKGVEKNMRRKIALKTIQDCNGNKRQAASKMGISYNTLWRIVNEK